MKKYTRTAVLMVAILLTLALSLPAFAVSDGRLNTIYFNNDYDFAFRMPKLWTMNTELYGYESKSSIFRYQLNVVFYPENCPVSGVRLNVVTLFVIENDNFTDKVKESGITPLFVQDGMTYGYRTYTNTYGNTAAGKRYDSLTTSLKSIESMFTPLYPSDETVAETMLSSFCLDIEDITMSPIRKTFETFGYTVSWDYATQSVTAVRGDDIYVIYSDSTLYTHNGEKHRASMEVRNISWTTYMSPEITRALIDNAFETGRIARSETGYVYMFSSVDTSSHDYKVTERTLECITTEYMSDAGKAKILALSAEEWKSLLSSGDSFVKLGETSDSSVVFATPSKNAVPKANFWYIG